MKSLLIITILLILVFESNAQKQIVVQRNNNSTFYEKLDSAIVHASNGDTIYLPGGSFLNSTQIRKKLHFVGAGYHPDSTKATFATAINHIQLFEGSDGGSITGIDTRLDLNYSCKDFRVSRCNVGIQSGDFIIQNLVCIENLIKSVSLTKGYFNIFLNNIFENTGEDYSGGGTSRFGSNTEFKNNVFLNYGGYMYVSNSSFKNNVFTHYVHFTGIKESEFRNNIFNSKFPEDNSSNVGTDNITLQAVNSIFVNYASGSKFSFSHDYHLKSTCPGKNAGTDGSDIGIYGGQYPWKEGSIPFNPHIQYFNINPRPDSNGNLKVNIKAKAQQY